MPKLIGLLNFGTVPMDQLFNVSSFLLVTVLVLMFGLVLYVVERTHAARTDKMNSQQDSQQSADK